MTGAPTWDQIIWLTGILSSVGGFCFLLAWKIAELRAKERHDTRSAFEQKLTSLDDKLDTQLDTLTLRLKVVEDFRSHTLAVLESVKEFRTDMDRKLDRLMERREHDMAAIHLRLTALFNEKQMDPNRDHSRD